MDCELNCVIDVTFLVGMKFDKTQFQSSLFTGNPNIRLLRRWDGGGVENASKHKDIWRPKFFH